MALKTAPKCPNCKTNEHVRKVVFGMPGPEFDFSKYSTVGCMPSFGDPEWTCLQCDWEKPSKRFGNLR